MRRALSARAHNVRDDTCQFVLFLTRVRASLSAIREYGLVAPESQGLKMRVEFRIFGKRKIHLKNLKTSQISAIIYIESEERCNS